MAWFQLGRQQCSEEAFKGPTVACSIDNAATIDLLKSTYDLWYFKFRQDTTSSNYYKQECIGYFGVYDIDIKEEERTRLIKQATIARAVESLREILQPELELVSQVFSDVPYVVYASGSKGLHVYTLDQRMFARLPKGRDFNPAFVKHFLSVHLPEAFVSLLDRSIYNMGSGIRPFTRSHPSTNVTPFRLIGSYQDDHDFFEFLRQHLPQVQFTTDLPTVPQSVARVPVQRQQLERPITDNTKHQSLLEYVKEKSGLATVTIEREKKGTIYLSGHWCPIKGHFHDENSFCTFWYQTNNKVWVCQCFASGCTKKRFFLRKECDAVTMPKDPKIRADSIKTIQVEGKYLPQAEMISIFNEQKRVVLCSGLGSGKTTLFLQYLKHLDQIAIEEKKPRPPVIVIGTRRSQCKCWFNKFAGQGFTDYDAVTGYLGDHDRVILCLNSVNRLVGPGGRFVIKPGTILLIDEVVAFCRWLGGSLLGKSAAASQPYIFELVKLLFDKCDQVICMDGLPDSIVSYFLDLINQLPRFHWVVNTSVSDDKLWKIYHHTRVFHDNLVRSINSGNKVALVCNLKSHIHTYMEYFTKELGVKSEEILAITGSMPEALRIFAGDPNGSWNNYRVILYNNSLGPGASYDFPSVFEVYGVCAAESGFDPVLALQLYNRIRTPINNVIHVLVLHKELSPYHSVCSGEKLLEKMCMTVSDYTRYATPIVKEFLEFSYGADQQQTDTEQCEAYELLNKQMGVARREDRPVTEEPSILRTNTVYDDTNNRLAQELAPMDQTFVLRFEPNPLLKLMSEIQAGSNNASLSSELFLKNLCDLITRSGGLIKVIGTPPETKKEKSFHYAYFKNMLSNKGFKPVHQVEDSYLFTPMPELTTKQNNKIKEALQLDTNNIEQFRRLYKVLIREGGEDQEPSAKYVALDATRNNLVPPLAEPVRTVAGELLVNQQAIPRSALNHSATMGELLPLVRELLDVTGMCVEEGSFTGKLDTEQFLFTSENVAKIVYKISKLRKRKEPAVHLKKIKSKIYERHCWLVETLLDVFKWLGFELEVAAKKRMKSPVDGKRHVVYTLKPDELAFRCKLASFGITKCGQKRSREEAYLSIFVE